METQKRTPIQNILIAIGGLVVFIFALKVLAPLLIFALVLMIGLALLAVTGLFALWLLNLVMGKPSAKA